MSDLRDALRSLRATPILTLAAIASLALGIGANTAIFSIVDALLLRSLPVHEPQRLAFLTGGAWSNPVWEQIRDRDLFEGEAAWCASQFDLAAGGQAEMVEGLWVSGSFFDVLGIRAVVGRTLTADDDRRGGGRDGPVAVISHRLWQERFGGSPDVVGRTLTVKRIPLTIAGVTPRDFFGPEVGRRFDIVVPLGVEPLLRGAESGLDAPNMVWLDVMVRLRPGQGIEAATAALRGVQPQIRAATMPRDSGPPGAGYLNEAMTLVPAAGGPSFIRERYARPLLAVLATVLLVLLIACANIANLMLARAATRRHEISVRLALGASRARIVRLVLLEGFVLSMAGAGIGLLFAVWSGGLVVSQFSHYEVPVFLEINLDLRVLGFTAAVAAAVTLLFATLPAWRTARAQPLDALQEQHRTATSDGGRIAGRALVIAQVAFSLVLVVAAGLFVRTFASLRTRDLGFDRERVLVMMVDAEPAGIDGAVRPAVFQQVTDAVAAVPGVADAAASAITPVSGMGWLTIFEFPELPALETRDRIVRINVLTPGWFQTYRMTMLAGRDFTHRDRLGAPAVAIVNQAFAKKYMRGQDPIGSTIRTAARGDRPGEALTIVGLVENTVYRSVREVPGPIVFRPMAQVAEGPPFVSVSVRAAAGSVEWLTPALVEASGRVHRDLSLAFKPLDDLVNDSLSQERVLAMLSGFFAALALLLGAVGLHGITAHAVSRRRVEIGIRMALGASRGAVVRLMMGRLLLPVAAGLTLGTALSLWAARFAGALLYALEPRDPLTLATAAIVLALVSALAAWLPARRAARIAPAEALRR